MSHRRSSARLAGALAALVAVPVAVAVTAVPSNADDAASDTGVIAFVQLDPGTSYRHHIYLMNADGTDRTQLTSSDWEDDATPALSPDGSQIAFVSTTVGVHGSNISVMNSDGTDRRDLTSGVIAADPAWSPDGSKIAFVESSNVDGSLDGVYVMSASGKDVHQVTFDNTADGTDGPIDYTPFWSPDGSKIAFARFCCATPGAFIYEVAADGTGLTQLPGTYVHAPVWSPDGSTLAYDQITGSGNNSGIFVRNADGSNATDLTPNAGGNNSPAWSPDGSKIVFDAYRNGDDDIYVMNADGTNQIDLTNDSLEQGYPSWGPRYVFPPKPPTVSTAPDSVWFGDTAQVGVQLTAYTVGSWTIRTSTLTPQFQWGTYNRATSVWTPIRGATSASFTPTPKQAGQALSVRATTTVPAGYTQPDPVDADPIQVSMGTLSTARPTIHGVLKVGKTLTAATGNWKAGDTTLTAKDFGYTWRANGRIVNAPRRPTLKLTKAMRAKRITVQVSGWSAGYEPAQMTSAQVGPVKR